MSAATHHYSEEDFRIVRVIGKGSLGKVMLVQEKATQNYYALKSIKKSDLPTEKQRQVARQEKELFVQTLFSCRSPFLVKTYATFQSASHLFYLLEYYPGGDLASLLAQTAIVSEPAVRFYAAELVLGLEVLRQLGIVYRDLKPENIVLTREGHLVLVDFGLSKVLEIPSECLLTRTFCGTAEYLAPEVLLGQPYGYAVDLWSLGTMVYEMLVGTPPYWAENPQEMYQKIVSASPIAFPTTVSPDAADFVQQLLRFEQHERLGYRRIDEIKAHPFFAATNWTAAASQQVPPPARPALSSDEDVRAFDDSFTSMAPAISPADRSFPAGASLRNYFSGFTFCYL